MQLLAGKKEADAKQKQLQAQQNKQLLELYHAAQAAIRAEAQATADAEAKEDASQVSCSTLLESMMSTAT